MLADASGLMPDSLKFEADQHFFERGLDGVDHETRTVRVEAGDSSFDAVVRIDTPGEAEYFRHGGILPYVLRSLLEK